MNAARPLAPWVFGVLAACGAGAGSTKPGKVGSTAPEGSTEPVPPPVQTEIRVQGNHLVDHGRVVRLLGVNHSGTEYGCVQGSGIFEGPEGDELVGPIVDWRANAIRVPLNESCWLDSRGADPRFSGGNYRDAIAGFVRRLRASGLYVIVELHFTAPGAALATAQQPMADADHAIDFWRSVASRFPDDLGVLFDLFNEPFLVAQDSWGCLRDGCVVSGTNGVGAYRTAGTQAMVDAVRGVGARNVILVPGLSYTSDLSGWLAHAPHDPLKQIAASLHLYNFTRCEGRACFSARYDAIAAAVPLITGEIGEDDCGHGFIDDYMRWADARGVSYLGWTWNTWDCSKGPALIRSYDGTPTPFGQGLRDHLVELASAPR